jgi:hypothetical protein
MKNLQERYSYYKALDDNGTYANPYTFDEEMTDLLNKSGLKCNSEEWLEWEDKILDLGREFLEY